MASSAKIMVIGGEFDGLNRITRLAESYWHTDIHSSQKGKFKTVVIKGMNHGQFADDQASKNPDYIKKHDLKA